MKKYILASLFLVIQFCSSKQINNDGNDYLFGVLIKPLGNTSLFILGWNIPISREVQEISFDAGFYDYSDQTKEIINFRAAYNISDKLVKFIDIPRNVWGLCIRYKMNIKLKNGEIIELNEQKQFDRVKYLLNEPCETYQSLQILNKNVYF